MSRKQELYPTKDELILDMKKTNQRTEGETMTSTTYSEEGKYDRHHARRRFGTWKNAKATAGIYKYGHGYDISEEELLQSIRDVNQKVEDRATTNDYREHGEYQLRTFYNRFESFVEARKKALD